MAWGENSPIASLWNQVLAKRPACFQNQVADVERLKKNMNCARIERSPEVSGGPLLGAPNLYENLIFNQALWLQKQKDLCLEQQMKSLFDPKNSKQRDTWVLKIVELWLAKRQMELVLKTCHDQFYGRGRLESSEIERYGQEEAQRRSDQRALARSQDLGPKAEPWRKLCFDHKELTRGQEQVALLTAALPFLSDPEFLKIIEKNRHVIRKRTNQPVPSEYLRDIGTPLSDADLLTMEWTLPSLESLVVPYKVVAPSLTDDLRKHFSSVVAKRKNLNAQMDKDRRTPFGGMSDAQKQYLFEEGSVALALEDAGELAGGKPTNAAACLTARYEKTLVGDLLDLGVTSAGIGALVKIGNMAKLIPELPKLIIPTPKLRSPFLNLNFNGFTGSALTSLGVGGRNMMVSDLYGNCFSTFDAQKRTDPAAKTIYRLAMGVAEKDYVDMTTFIELPPDEIPACRNGAVQALITNNNHHVNCVLSVMTNPMPLKMGLPTNLIFN